MPDVTGHYGRFSEMRNELLESFFNNCRPFMSEVLNLHQSFIDCMAKQNRYFVLSRCQM